MFNIQLLIKHEGSGHLPIIRSGLLFTNFLCLHRPQTKDKIHKDDLENSLIMKN